MQMCATWITIVMILGASVFTTRLSAGSAEAATVTRRSAFSPPAHDAGAFILGEVETGVQSVAPSSGWKHGPAEFDGQARFDLRLGGTDASLATPVAGYPRRLPSLVGIVELRL